MNIANVYKPSRLNLDKAKKYLTNIESSFLLNHDVNNPGAIGKATPLAANYLACDTELPAGENYTLDGGYYSPITNENYTFHYNSNNAHHIQRINGDGDCEIVYFDQCLRLNAAPRHTLAKSRILLDIDEMCNKVPGGKLKRLIWVDGTDTPMGCLDVEASIATNSFSTPFFDICPDPCAYIAMCVPEPNGCLLGDFVPYTQADNDLSNKILDRALKFAYRHIYYDGRASELSAFSSLYFQDAKGCFDNLEGFSRCIKFRLPIGNPMVEKIEFYFSEDGGLTWFLYETVEKYKKYNSSQQYWYQRDLSEEVSSSFSDTDCAFDYVFCNDKQRIPIDPKLLTRVTNPIPREAQGIFRIKDTIAAFNYVSGNCPLDKNEVDKFQIDVSCPPPTVDCTPKMAKVTVRAIVYCDVTPSESGGGGPIGGYIFRPGGGIGGAVDDEKDTAWFGTGFQILDQNFTPGSKIRNFIPYIEGTDYWGEMEQWRSAPNFTSVRKVGVLSGLQEIPTRKAFTNEIRSGNFYYNEYVFSVPQGTKGFVRLVSHKQTSGSGFNQNTSTQVVGTLGANGLKSYNGAKPLSNVNDGVSPKELYFDTCNGDYEDFDAFIVHDVTFNDDGGYSGYITDKNNAPVEGALIAAPNLKTYTDFNGFYAFHDVNGLLGIDVKVEQNCNNQFQTIGTFTGNIDIDSNQMGHFDYKIDSDYYASNMYAEVGVTVRNCTDAPVRGVRVAMSGSKYKVTDSNGTAHFKLRNYANRSRQIRAVVMDKGGCFSYDCQDNCNPCLPATELTLLMPCFQGTPDYSLTPTSKLNTANLIANRKGLKDGGRYPFGIVAKGDCGKISAVNEISYIDIPRIQETGGVDFCSFSYAANGMLLPSWVKEILIVRGVNVNPYYLQWIVDTIEYTTDGKIKLTIQSLNDYNTKYNFKTNTVYQYLPGDRIEFKKNGDGIIFDSATYGILNYNILSPFNDEIISGVTNDTKYFNQIIIVDDGKLGDLKEGAVIEIQPQSSATETLTYFGICATIPVENGQVEIQDGTFETFDTYLVSRQIGQYSSQLFAHNYPSDFWGSSVGNLNYNTDIGRAFFVNPYENEKRYPRNISISSATQLNYFGDLVKTLDAEDQGGIVAVNVKDDTVGLAICENDNFIFQISDEFLRVASNGVVMAAPADSIISNPDPKVVGRYGCQYQDIGSIFFGDGYACFIDGHADTYIIHNYSYAKIAASYIEDGQVVTTCNSYFRKRNREKEKFNKSTTDYLSHYRYTTGINKACNVVYLTLKSLRLPGVNNEKSVYAAKNETIIFHAATDSFSGFASFTCEGYSELSLDTDEGCAFLTFQNSQPFIHELVPTKWNEFYGITVDQVVGITVSAGNKVVVPLSIEVQSKEMFFVYDVTTDSENFRSEIPPVRFKRNNDKWNAAILNDINSRGGLYNGTAPRGYFVNLLFLKNNTVNLVYRSIDTQRQTQYNELDNILIKSMVSEQSGFTANL